MKKVQHRSRYYNRAGILVQMDPDAVFPANVLAGNENEFNASMQFYLSSCWFGAAQFDLNGGPQNSIYPETLYGPGDWARLRNLLLTNNLLTDLHYFGHGSSVGIGTVAGNIRTTLMKTMISTNPLSYVALDGCETAENADMFKALVDYTKLHTRLAMAGYGWKPAFAWGWKGQAGVVYPWSSTLFHPHFNFVADFYESLTRLDGNQFVYRTFEQSMEFAKTPNGGSTFDPSIQTNSEGGKVRYVGCRDCRFDQL